MTAARAGSSNWSGFSQNSGSLSDATFDYKDRDNPANTVTYTVGWLEYEAGNRTYLILSKELPDPATGGQYTLLIPKDGPDQDVYGEYKLTHWKNDNTSWGNGNDKRSWYTVSDRNRHFKNGASYTVRLYYDAPAPAKPTGLSAAPGETWVELTWTNPNNDDIKQWEYQQKAGSGKWSVPVYMGGNPDKTSHRAWRLANGTAYQFQIRALSNTKASVWSDAVSVTPKTAPDAPTRFRATPGSQQVRLQWELPADSTISQWQYRYKTAGDYGSWTQLSTTASTRTYTVTGLTNGTEYTFQVRANTGTGNSRVLGDSSDEWSATPAAFPSLCSGTLTAGAGTGVHAGHTGYYNGNPRGYGSLGLGCRVFVYRDVVYTIHVIRHTGDAVQVKLASWDKRLPTDVESGLELHVGNAEYDLSWDGEKSEYTAATTTSPFTDSQSYAVSLHIGDDDTPVAPTGFTATAGTDFGEVALAWDEWSDGTFPITKWQYRQKTTGNYGGWQDITGDSSTTSHTVTGLATGTTYTFQLRAFSTTGGTASDEKSAEPYSVDAPGGFNALPGRTQVTLVWDEWSDNSVTITKWQYSYKTTGNYGNWTDITGGSSTTSHTVTGLTNGTAYTFKVRAYTTGGGDDSAEKSATPNADILFSGALTVGVDPNDANAKGYSGSTTGSYGKLLPTTEFTFTHSGTEYTRIVRYLIHDGSKFRVRFGPTNSDIQLPTGVVTGLKLHVGSTEHALTWGGTTSYNSSNVSNPFTVGQTYIVKLTTSATVSGNSAPGSVNAEGGNGQVRVGWQMPGGGQGGAGGAGAQGVSGQGATAMTYEVAWTKQDAEWSEGGSQTSGTMEATVTGLENGQPYAFRVRAQKGGETSPWSGTVHATPADSGPSLTQPFADLAMANAAVHSLDMGEHFSGTDLTYEVMVTTTHKRTGEVKTAPINTVARNKVHGAWSDDLLTLTAGPSGDHVLALAVTATDGDGATASDSFQLTVGSTDADTPLSAPTGLAGTSGDGEVSLTWTAPADNGGAAVASYEVDVGIGGDWDEGPQNVTGITETSTTVTGLTNGTAHDFRVRAVNSAGAGAWSATVSVTPVAPATLILEFPDLELANGEVHTIDMAEHFSGTGLAYEVMVTTTHKRTGQVKTGPINTVARNKVRGAWSGHVLTLTAGPSGHHVLGLEVIATDLAGGTASDDFQLTVGMSETESLATEALRNALASQARSMLEDASSAIGGRMQSGGAGTDALTAFAGLFGGGQGVGECPLDESLQECMTRDAHHRDAPLFGGPDGFGVSSFDETGESAPAYPIDLSELRDRVKGQGFAVSLNQPMPGTSSSLDSPEVTLPDDAVALTFWGQGAPSSGVTDTVFWGLDASMGDRWMTGFAFAESGAEVTQSLSRGDLSVSGFAESDISAVYPYLRSRFGSGTEVWSLMGFGNGQVDSTWTGMALGVEETVELDGDVAFDLGLVGAEQSLFERGGFSLSALGDAGWSRLSVTSGRAEGVEARVSRTRLGVEGRYAAEDGTWSSGLRAGARVDGGDGTTASGMELMGDVRRTWGRWQAGVEGRWYAADTADAAHGAQGVQATFGLQPRANGTGLGLTVSPGWGTHGELVKQDGLLASLGDGPVETQPALRRKSGRVAWGQYGRANGECLSASR